MNDKIIHIRHLDEIGLHGFGTHVVADRVVHSIANERGADEDGHEDQEVQPAHASKRAGSEEQGVACGLSKVVR